MALIEPLAQAVYDTDWATAIRESEVLFPVLEAIHVMGLALVAGTIAVVDLRLLGLVLRDAPPRAVERAIVPWTWAGFAVMALTGSLLLASEAAKLVHNPALWVKLVALALAGGNVALFQWRASPALHAVPAGGAVPGAARAGAALSLALWAVVIAAGRAIAYF